MQLSERLHNFFWYHIDRIEWITLALLLLVLILKQEIRLRFIFMGFVLIIGSIMVFYSQSKLFMDFAERFTFALVLPLIMFLVCLIDWKTVPINVAILPLVFVLWIPHEQKQRHELKDLTAGFSHQSFLNTIGMIMHRYADTRVVVTFDITEGIPCILVGRRLIIMGGATRCWRNSLYVNGQAKDIELPKIDLAKMVQISQGTRSDPRSATGLYGQPEVSRSHRFFATSGLGEQPR